MDIGRNMELFPVCSLLQISTAFSRNVTTV